jgi:[ribosomal protein S5]-alanine N-acetyltransferase
VRTFTTKRLVATQLSVADLDALVTLHRDPTVMATLGGVRSAGNTRRYLRANVRHWERHGFGLWIFRAKSDRRFVGRGGLRRVMIQGRPETEITYALARTFWGEGLATEIARATVDIADALGATDLVAFAVLGHERSFRVMRKVGFRYERDIVHAGVPCVLYRHSA